MQDVINAVEKYRDLMLYAERYIWNNPETGFREVKTSKYMEQEFEKLGYNLIKAGDIPGFYTVIDTGRSGPEVLVLGELDSLIVENHPEANKETGYVHACGHNVSCATLLGLAGALKDENVLSKLSGRIRLCAVPAEELIEIDFRSGLKEKGLIKYLGGKTEFLHRGYFDGVDMAFMVHANNNYATFKGAVGCIAKVIKYKGKSAHAGSSPWKGKNALYAATQGLTAVNALRETFKEQDKIRFHPIITNGGDVVNAIPELVTIETFVRGATYNAILDANKRINQALIGSALSIGVQIEIVDTPGYSPLVSDDEMNRLIKECADEIIPEENFYLSYDSITGSTDMGDLTMIMPAIHAYSGGIEGNSHSMNYFITDPERAVIKSTKMQLLFLTKLLENNAEKAKEIIKNFKPTFSSKEEYLSFVDKLNRSGDRIIYGEDKIEIKVD